MDFYYEKLLDERNRDREGLIDRLGAQDVKRTEEGLKTSRHISRSTLCESSLNSENPWIYTH